MNHFAKIDPPHLDQWRSYELVLKKRHIGACSSVQNLKALGIYSHYQPHPHNVATDQIRCCKYSLLSLYKIIFSIINVLKSIIR